MAAKKKPAKKKVAPSPALATVVDIRAKLAQFAAPSTIPTAPERPTAKASTVDAAASLPPLALPDGARAVAESVPKLVGQAALLKLSAGTLDEAREMLKAFKTRKEQLESMRKFLTKPLKEHVARLEALFRPTMVILDDADKALRLRVQQFQMQAEQEVETARAQLAAAAQEAFETGDDATALQLSTEATTLQAASIKGATAGGGGVGLASVTKFKIVDMALIPDHYWTIDEKRIAADVKAGLREIPGVEVYAESQLRVSTRDRELKELDS